MAGTVFQKRLKQRSIVAGARNLLRNAWKSYFQAYRDCLLTVVVAICRCSRLGYIAQRGLATTVVSGLPKLVVVAESGWWRNCDDRSIQTIAGEPSGQEVLL